MATVNHIRLARISRAFADECAREHQRRDPGHRHGSGSAATVDPYTRRSNICPECHTTKALNGSCFC